MFSSVSLHHRWQTQRNANHPSLKVISISIICSTYLPVYTLYATSDLATCSINWPWQARLRCEGWLSLWRGSGLLQNLSLFTDWNELAPCWQLSA